jgi:hypothetical protein
MGYGVTDCGIPFGDDANIFATLGKVADMNCLDIHRLIGGASELSSHAAFSMAYFSCIRRADFLAGAIPSRLTKYFCAKTRETPVGVRVCAWNGSPRNPCR